MKIGFQLSILLLCAAAASAQPATETFAPAGVTITKFGSRPLEPERHWDARTGSTSAASQSMEDLRSLPSREQSVNSVPVPAGVIPPIRGRERPAELSKEPRVRDVIIDPLSDSPQQMSVRPNRSLYQYEARIKNIGDRTITGVAWEYWFIHTISGQQMDRRRFRTVRRLEPGKSATLNVKSYGPRVITAANNEKKSKQFEERVVIKCVAYSDGKISALGTSSEAECADLRNKEQSQH